MTMLIETQNINLNPDDLDDVACSKCECQTFEPVFLFKKLSAIMAPSGRDTLVPLQTYRCTDCGNMNDEFLPKSEKQKKYIYLQQVGIVLIQFKLTSPIFQHKGCLN